MPPGVDLKQVLSGQIKNIGGRSCLEEFGSKLKSKALFRKDYDKYSEAVNKMEMFKRKERVEQMIRELKQKQHDIVPIIFEDDFDTSENPESEVDEGLKYIFERRQEINAIQDSGYDTPTGLEKVSLKTTINLAQLNAAN
jgi:hypothetical protein